MYLVLNCSKREIWNICGCSFFQLLFLLGIYFTYEVKEIYSNCKQSWFLIRVLAIISLIYISFPILAGFTRHMSSNYLYKGKKNASLPSPHVIISWEIVLEWWDNFHYNWKETLVTSHKVNSIFSCEYLRRTYCKTDSVFGR